MIQKIEKFNHTEVLDINIENKEKIEKEIDIFEEENSLEINENIEKKESETISLKERVLLEKQEKINDILEYGLSENYSKLSEEKKKFFKEEGEKLILEIVLMIDKNPEDTFIKKPEIILEQIQKWLISGFGNNPYSIQQSKIIFDNLKDKFYK